MSKFGRVIENLTVFFAFLIICIFISVLSPDFLTISNLRNVILQASINAVLAVGLTFVILTAGIDLSVGSILAFAGIVLGHALHAGVPLPVALLICLIAGALCGLVNGFLVTKGQLPPFIATLGMMSIARGLALVASNGNPISSFGESFRFIANGQLLGIPVLVIITAIVYIIAHIVLTRVPFGRYVYAVGGNEEAARLSGVNTNKVLNWVYIISGFLSGLGAIMLTSRLNSAQPTAGIMYELDAIAATVIGGTSLMGGYGGVGGTLIGALIISVIRNGLNLMNVSSFIQQSGIGGVIILAVLIDRLKDKYKGRFNLKEFVKKYAIAIILIVILAIIGLVYAGIKTRTQKKLAQIALIVKTLNNPFFINMQKGAEEEIKKYPEFDLIVQAPEREIDVEKQIQFVENMIQKKVKAICIAPSGSKEILSGIVKANKAGIPVIIIDTRVDEKQAKVLSARYETFIGSDNYEGGRIAGRFIARKLNGSGNVAILEGIAGHETVDQRKRGCLDVLKDYPGIKIVASQTANAERGQGFDVTQNILQAHPEVNAIFACNDQMALGAVEAVNQAGRKGEILIVGFDAIKDAKEAIMRDEMAGSIAQYPSEMGRRAVESAVKLIKGKKVPREIPTKVEMITKELLQKEM
ncbi:MAG: substrate-binding domain-containing protein, partial [Candidatus Eremiobacteraeota bacterium]|nr:substrate-binding domain-containing protein [Candidatus Eremiobacteraeota bacterium]